MKQKMYSASMEVLTKEGQKIFMIMGIDSEDIVKTALKYGTDPVFVSGMTLLNKDWWLEVKGLENDKYDKI